MKRKSKEKKGRKEKERKSKNKRKRIDKKILWQIKKITKTIYGSEYYLELVLWIKLVYPSYKKLLYLILQFHW